MCFSFLQYLVQYSVTWAWACHSVWISWVCEVLTVFPQVLQCMTLFTNFWLPDIIFKERKESKCQFPLLPLKIVMNISCQGERLSSSFFVHKRNMTCTDIDHAQGMHDQLRINLDPLAKLKRWSTAVRCLGRKRPLITDKRTDGQTDRRRLPSALSPSFAVDKYADVRFRRVLCLNGNLANMLDSTCKSASCKLQASIPDGIASFQWFLIIYLTASLLDI